MFLVLLVAFLGVRCYWEDKVSETEWFI